jgi:hypothetical protein
MRKVLLALGVVLLAFIACAQSSLLIITVRSQTDPTNSHPDSRLYIATAKNVSDQRVYLPAAKLAGGYSGEGTFFPCVVEVKGAGKWTAVHEVKLENVSGKRDPTYLRLEPGESIEVCRALLPEQGGKHGAVARFVLLRDWNIDAPRWVVSTDVQVE